MHITVALRISQLYIKVNINSRLK